MLDVDNIAVAFWDRVLAGTREGMHWNQPRNCYWNINDFDDRLYLVRLYLACSDDVHRIIALSPEGIVSMRPTGGSPCMRPC